MRTIRLLVGLLVILNVGFFALPSQADETLDEECATYCIDNGFEDGHYVAPEPGATCDDGYEQDETNPICCCQ